MFRLTISFLLVQRRIRYAGTTMIRTRNGFYYTTLTQQLSVLLGLPCFVEGWSLRLFVLLVDCEWYNQMRTTIVVQKQGYEDESRLTSYCPRFLVRG